MDKLSQKDITKDMRNFTHDIKKHSAFTMIELIMVIIVLGILTALAIPRLNRDLTQEAADDILSQIRFTQHMALVDDKHRFNQPDWQRSFWRIMFSSCSDGSLAFRIGSDSDRSGGGFTAAEAALDPINGRPFHFANNGDCDLTTISPNIRIGKKYGITAIAGKGGCNNIQNIGFDHLGRPHVGFEDSNIPNYNSYMTNTCTFTFTINDNNFSIDIEPETGYAHITGQNNS